MRANIVKLFLILCVFFLSGCDSIVTNHPYELHFNNNDLFKIDSSTGDTWVYDYASSSWKIIQTIKKE